MMEDLLHLGRVLLQNSNGATAADECARSNDDQVCFSFPLHCTVHGRRAVHVSLQLKRCKCGMVAAHQAYAERMLPSYSDTPLL